MFNISVLVNTFAVIIGSLIGKFIGDKLSDKYKKMMFSSVGLVTMVIGVQMGFKANDFTVVLISLVLGGLLGEFSDIEGKIAKLANKLEKSEGETKFVKGYVTATVLFVIGPMTILGCIRAGVSNDNSLIFLKSLLDFISAIIFASIYGFGVLFSAFSVFILQGLLVLFASNLSFLSQPSYLNDFTAVGGLMVLAIGLRLLEIKEIKVGNYLPALIVVMFADWIKLLIK